jgi:ribose/xylose/arabinose/galactoside ABC-type transport system permease subunit
VRDPFACRRARCDGGGGGYGVRVPLTIVGGASVGTIAGVVNSLLVTQAGMAPFIATLGMLSASHGRGGRRAMLAAALATWSAKPRTFTESPFAPVR